MAMFVTYIVMGSHYWERRSTLEDALDAWFRRAYRPHSYCEENEVWVYRIYGDSKKAEETVDKSYIDDMGGLCYHDSLKHKKFVFKLDGRKSDKLVRLNDQVDELSDEIFAPVNNSDDFWED